MKGFMSVSVLVTALILGTAATAAADADYHSERLELTGAADPDFHGQVVNIHPNGPVNGALERYQVAGATPTTSYDVWIQSCTAGGFEDFIQTAVLVTDAHGNGQAQAAFTAEDLEPFSGSTISIRWALKSGDAIVYTTPCTTVSID
jgi:hypothetical protein